MVVQAKCSHISLDKREQRQTAPINALDGGNSNILCPYNRNTGILIVQEQEMTLREAPNAGMLGMAEEWCARAAWVASACWPRVDICSCTDSSGCFDRKFQEAVS